LFSIKYEIDVFPAFFSLLTILIGIYIAVVIQKNISDKRVQKDIFINRLTEIKDTFHKIDEEINSLRRFDELNCMFKNLLSKLAILERLLTHSKLSRFDKDIEILKTTFISYKQITTGKKVVRNKYSYTEDELIRIHKLKLDILEKADVFILNINTN
jgi:hypothetical protein